MFRSIHHVAVIASDYALSKAFYVDALGFRILRESYREERRSWKADLLADDRVQIELFSFPETPPRVTRPEACGLRHLCLTTDDLDAVKWLLEQRGVRTEEIRVDEGDGKRFFFLFDPDDLPIEVRET